MRRDARNLASHLGGKTTHSGSCKPTAQLDFHSHEQGVHLFYFFKEGEKKPTPWVNLCVSSQATVQPARCKHEWCNN